MAGMLSQADGPFEPGHATPPRRPWAIGSRRQRTVGAGSSVL